MAHAHPSTMIDETIQALNMPAQPTSANDLIKDWISVLTHTEGADAPANTLTALYDELHNNEPGAERVRNLLNQLAQQVESLAPTTGKVYTSDLEQLATSLRSFATGLGEL